MVDKAWYESLPRKRMATGCIFFNAENMVLLVKPTYKDGWEIPGGVVENNESPKTACEREVLEEIGLNVSVKGLLIVDYNSYPRESQKTESLMFIFDGGILSDDKLSSINVNEDEIKGYEFFSVDKLPKEMNHSLRNRVIQAIKQKDYKCSIYLENQQII
ncbi:MAG: NUDIX hydrolase [Chloroflexota bacterium]